MVSDPRDIYKNLVQAGTEWANADRVASLLEETKKVILAQLMNSSDAKTISAKEQEALANPLYQSHIEKMVEAREAANVAKVKYMSLQTGVELQRTKEVTERHANKYAT